MAREFNMTSRPWASKNVLHVGLRGILHQSILGVLRKEPMLHPGTPTGECARALLRHLHLLCRGLATTTFPPQVAVGGSRSDQPGNQGPKVIRFWVWGLGGDEPLEDDSYTLT